MEGIGTLLGLRRRIAWNVLSTIGQHSRLKVLSIAVLGGGIWVGLYVFPYYGFEWAFGLLREGSISDMLVSLFFFLLMIMLVASNAVIIYAALFRSSEAAFLRSAPLPPGTVFFYKLVESLAFSSWTFFLLGVPMMLAYGVHKGAPWYYYIALIVFFAGFVLIPACAGALIALVLSTLLRPWMRRALVWAAVLTAVAALIVGPVYLRRRRTIVGFLAATRLLGRVSFSNSVYWPSTWVSRGLAICAGTPGPENLGDAAYYFGMLASNSLLLCLVAHAFASRAYNGAWDRIHSMSSRPRSKRLVLALSGRGPASPMFQLILKDLKTFVRDPVQWTQCAVLFGLLGLYILNLRNLRYPAAQPLWRSLTTFLNLAAICLVLATLTTRFVFPLFSLEGRRFWMLGPMPISRRQVLWSKLVFSLVASLAVTEVLMVTSDLMIGEPPWMMAVHILTVGMISLGLSGLAVGLSALYPNLRETNPAKIVSGFGGTLNLILSLFFVSLAVAIEAVPVCRWVAGHISHSQMVTHLCAAVGVIGVLSLVAFGVPMWLGSRALEKMEF